MVGLSQYLDGMNPGDQPPVYKRACPPEKPKNGDFIALVANPAIESVTCNSFSDTAAKEPKTLKKNLEWECQQVAQGHLDQVRQHRVQAPSRLKRAHLCALRVRGLASCGASEALILAMATGCAILT